MVRVPAEVKRSTVARLEQLRDDGVLSVAHVDLAARSLGVAPRTVWRWLRMQAGPAEAPQARVAYTLSATDREAYAFYRGSVAAVHRAREAVLNGGGATAGAPVPEFLVQGWLDAEPVARRTLSRVFAKEMTPAERAAWKRGENARREKLVYLARPASGRGQVWEMDHKQLPLLVLPPKGKAVCPWVTTIVDDGTRALLGWALALYPSSATVLAAMRMALVHESDRGPFGAVPSRVRIDRGLEFAAEPITSVMGALCVTVHRLPPFLPFRKGKVERLNLTIEQTLVSLLPGFTGGPRDAEVGPMRIERFAERFATWVHWYNTERRHRMLADATPLEAWNADPGPIHRIGADRLRHLLLADTERTVGKDGIHFNGLTYLAPQIQGRVGQRVEIRYMPHDDRSIEVYLDGVHLCTAHPSGQLTPEQTEAFRVHAARETKRLGQERRRAAGRARRELAPMTGQQGEAVETRMVPARSGLAVTRQSLDTALRARASTSLLGLKPVTPIAKEN